MVTEGGCLFLFFIREGLLELEGGLIEEIRYPIHFTLYTILFQKFSNSDAETERKEIILCGLLNRRKESQFGEVVRTDRILPVF